MRRLFGGILMGCGLLIAGISGLCTIAILISTIGMLADGRGQFFDAMQSGLGALAAGVIPLLIGLGLAWIGRKIVREDDPAP